MAVLEYVSSTPTTRSISQITPAFPSPSNYRPTKILLPGGRPLKFSRGATSGEYFSAPTTTTKLRRYWGGEEEDPLTSDEYIWSKDFMGLKGLLGTPMTVVTLPFNELLQSGYCMNAVTGDDPVSSDWCGVSCWRGQPSGFLSLNRVMEPDSLDVDLSEALKENANTIIDYKLEDVSTQSTGRTSPQWRPAPTRREQEKWNRATKAATGGSEMIFRELRHPQEDPEKLAAQSWEQYFHLKMTLQLLTLGIGSVGFVSAYISCSPEVAASFGVGLLRSVVYIHMLGNSIDSMASGAKEAVKGPIAQPRLLVPIALVMIYNRWNEILVPDYGFGHLELIPMLVGFFTYKIATHRGCGLRSWEIDSSLKTVLLKQVTFTSILRSDSQRYSDH